MWTAKIECRLNVETGEIISGVLGHFYWQLEMLLRCHLFNWLLIKN